MSADACGKPEKGVRSLGNIVIGGCVLGTELQFSAKAASTLHHGTISPVPPCLFLKLTGIGIVIHCLYPILERHTTLRRKLILDVSSQSSSHGPFYYSSLYLWIRLYFLFFLCKRRCTMCSVYWFCSLSL